MLRCNIYADGAARATAAMLQMRKLDVGTLEAAYRGES